MKYNVLGDIPSNDQLRQISNPIGSTLHASNGNIIGRYFIQNRGKLKAEDLTPAYKNALVATEDIRFYEHHGIDYKSLGRVVIKSILMQNQKSGGGSTLTQQLAKNLYPRKRYKFLSIVVNKFREMNIAIKLERLYSKDELLLLYSNTVSFGERAFGLHTASHRFFNKSPKDLSLVESACLVGILKAPTYYSPKKNPQRAVKRRNTVLAQMAKHKMLDSLELKVAMASDLKLDYQSLMETMGLGRYFQRRVRAEFEEWAKQNKAPDGSLYDIELDGLKIFSSLDYELQIVAENNMQQHMITLQKVFDRSWKRGNLFGKNNKYIIDRINKDLRYIKMIKEGKSREDAMSYFDEVAPIEKWTWNGSKTDSISRADSIKHVVGLLHAGILAIDVKTGFIKVWVGGNDYGEFQWDNVLSPRQVGSTFKPIVYLTALENGVHPCDYHPNELRKYTSFDDWTPKNANGKYGGYLSTTEALTHSVNTVSIQMLFKAGIPRVIKKAKELGVSTFLPEVPSIVLGTADISLFDMVNVYASIARGGKKITPRCITKIEDAHGKILYKIKDQKEHKVIALDSSVIGLNSMLKQVCKVGTGARLYRQFEIPFDVMGKTGTTQNQTDGWFISYTGDLAIGSWVGAQDRRIHFRNLGTGSGGRTALPLVGALWEYKALKGYRPSVDITHEMGVCLDSIGVEEYLLLDDGYGEDRYASIYRHRNPNIIDLIIGLDDRLDRESSSSKVKRKKRRRKKRETRMKRYNRFKQKLEKILKG